MSSADVQSLLRAAPWLRKYGTLLAERLVQLGVSGPEQIAEVDRERFAALPDVGKGALLDLLAAQRELGHHRSRPPSATARVTPDTWVRDIPAIRDRFPVRLLNSLGKLGANTVEQVLHVTADAFAEVRGVGAEQVRLLDELKTELGELSARNASLADDQAIDDESADVDASDAGAGAEEGPRPIDGQPIDGIWEVWSGLPVPLRNCLRANGIHTVAQVLAMEPADFAEFRGVGAKRVQAFVELRESLRYMRLQQGVDAAHGSALADGDVTPSSDTPVHAIEEVAATWPSLEALLRDVAGRMSANRGHTADRERNHEIWLWHHGLGQTGGRTLDAIGAAHGLTRERVRQIVSRLNRLVAGEIERSAALAPFRTALKNVMAQCLGIARTEDLTRLIQEQMGWEQRPTPETLEVLVDIIDSTPLRLSLRRGEGVVEHPDACQALRQRVAAEIEDLLQEIHESEHILDFVYHLTQACRNGNCERSRFTSQVPCCGGERGETNLPCEYVTAVLSEMTPSPLDGDRVWGYWWTRLRVRRPKTEAMRAALHILGQPVHYSELVEFIGKHNPAFDRTDERYVAGQLASSDEYVCTGEPGVYGLREWGGVRFATVEDRVEKLLRKRGGTMHQRGICRNLGAQGISRSSVHAALRDARFAWGADGWVRLVDEAAAPSPVLISSGPVPVLIGDDEDAGYIL